MTCPHLQAAREFLTSYCEMYVALRYLRRSEQIKTLRKVGEREGFLNSKGLQVLA